MPTLLTEKKLDGKSIEQWWKYMDSALKEHNNCETLFRSIVEEIGLYIAELFNKKMNVKHGKEEYDNFNKKFFEPYKEFREKYESYKVYYDTDKVFNMMDKLMEDIQKKINNMSITFAPYNAVNLEQELRNKKKHIKKTLKNQKLKEISTQPYYTPASNSNAFYTPPLNKLSTPPLNKIPRKSFKKIYNEDANYNVLKNLLKNKNKALTKFHNEQISV